jgi:hypothetical protein
MFNAIRIGEGMQFVTQIKSELTMEEIKSTLQSLQSKPLLELRTIDLVQLSIKGHYHGLYFFYKHDVLMYVGSCRSRTFLNRLPCHWDTFSDAWMNTLIQKIEKREDRTRVEIASDIMNNYALKVISVPQFQNSPNAKEANQNRKKELLKIERDLRYHLKPELNKAKSASLKSQVYYQAVLEIEESIQREIEEEVRLEAIDTSTTSLILMVNVTQWDDKKTMKENEEQAARTWNVSDKKIDAIEFLAAWKQDEVKKVWKVQGHYPQDGRFTFKLGEDVTHIYKTLIENEVGEGYRMYHTRRYIAF